MENPILLAGLGNPGLSYAKNRHNVGFMVLDEMAARMGGLHWQSKFNAMISRTTIGGTSVLMLKPHTFMNISGRAIAAAMTFFKYSVQQICIIHDDIELACGMVRLKTGGGTGGHNGLKSCDKELGSRDYHRVRLGVGRPIHGDVSNYVLSDFTPDEVLDLDTMIDTACDSINCLITSGMVKAMNMYNKRQGDN